MDSAHYLYLILNCDENLIVKAVIANQSNSKLLYMHRSSIQCAALCDHSLECYYFKEMDGVCELASGTFPDCSFKPKGVTDTIDVYKRNTPSTLHSEFNLYVVVQCLQT